MTENGRPAPSNSARNVYQRKLAVMARCGAIDPDKTHPAHKFKYVSIQTLSNHLRRFAAEEGLDITVAPNGEGDRMVVKLTNVDQPTEQIVESWPIVEGDKGWAYSTKFPLIRMFLVGDGEEADETEMADRAAAQSQRSQPARHEDFTPPREARPARGGREALYEVARDAGKDREWVDRLIDVERISPQSIAVKLQKELAKMAQQGQLPPLPADAEADAAITQEFQQMAEEATR